jgi:hypothetical protein
MSVPAKPCKVRNHMEEDICKGRIVIILWSLAVRPEPICTISPTRTHHRSRLADAWSGGTGPDHISRACGGLSTHQPPGTTVSTAQLMQYRSMAGRALIRWAIKVPERGGTSGATTGKQTRSRMGFAIFTTEQEMGTGIRESY